MTALAPALIAPLIAQAAAQDAGEVAEAPTDPASIAQPAPRFELSVPLTLNARYLGNITVEVAADGAAFVDGARLKALLVPRLGAEARQALSAAPSDVAPVEAFEAGGLALTFDQASLQLDAAIITAGLSLGALPIAGRPLPQLEDFAPPEGFSAGLGVAVAAGQTLRSEVGATRDPVRAALEGYARVGGRDGVTVFAAADVIEGAPEPVRRREVLAVKDFYGSAVRATAGDALVPVAGFQTAPPILGLTAARQYATIQPFRNIRSTGRGTIVLERDSLVDVFVNDTLVDTIQLEAGRYELTDFPLATGSNDIRLVARDELGREEVAAFSAFSQAVLLGPGVLDFGVAGGVERRVTAGGFGYGDDPLGSGFVNYGLTERLNLGATVQLSEEIAQLGAIVSAAVPFGTARLSAAVSDADARGQGYAARLDYQARGEVGGNPASLDAAAAYTDARFSGLAGLAADEKFSAQVLLRAQLPGRVSLNLSTASIDFHGPRPGVVRASAGFGRSFGRLVGTVNANYTRRASFADQDAEEEVAVLASLALRLGERGALRARAGTRENLREVELTRARRRQLGDLSGRLRASTSDRGDRVSATGAYFGNRFEAEADLEDIARPGRDAVSQARLRVASFVGYADGTFAVGRSAPEGFVIVKRHRSLEGSEVVALDASGQRDFAEAGAFGPALVPVERAYLPRRIEMRVDPLPTGYDLGSGGEDVLPPLGGGYVLQVGSDASRTVLGVLTDAEGEPVALKSGRFERVDGNEALSRQVFTNSRGRFVAERIAAGEYVLIVDGVRSGTVVIEEDTEGMVDAGIVVLE